MEVEFFDSLEEAQARLRRAMKAADGKVKPWQAAIRPGDCFIADSGEEGLLVFGEVLEGYTEPHLRHYRFCRCYSVACPGRRTGRRARVDHPLLGQPRVLRGDAAGRLADGSGAAAPLRLPEEGGRASGLRRGEGRHHFSPIISRRLQASRLPRRRTGARPANCFFRGRDLPASQE